MTIKRGVADATSRSRSEKVEVVLPDEEVLARRVVLPSPSSLTSTMVSSSPRARSTCSSPRTLFPVRASTVKRGSPSPPRTPVSTRFKLYVSQDVGR
jgi:hypothetical protein